MKVKFPPLFFQCGYIHAPQACNRLRAKLGPGRLVNNRFANRTSTTQKLRCTSCCNDSHKTKSRTEEKKNCRTKRGGEDSWNNNVNPYLAGYYCCRDLPRKRNPTPLVRINRENSSTRPEYTSKKSE